METMLIAPGVYADFNTVGNDIVVIRVRRANGYIFNDPRAIELAVSTIRAVRDGWMKITP